MAICEWYFRARSVRTWFLSNHDDVIKWKHFPRYWPFVRGIHRSLLLKYPIDVVLTLSDLCISSSCYYFSFLMLTFLASKLWQISYKCWTSVEYLNMRYIRGPNHLTVVLLGIRVIQGHVYRILNNKVLDLTKILLQKCTSDDDRFISVITIKLYVTKFKSHSLPCHYLWPTDKAWEAPKHYRSRQ